MSSQDENALFDELKAITNSEAERMQEEAHKEFHKWFSPTSINGLLACNICGAMVSFQLVTTHHQFHVGLAQAITWAIAPEGQWEALPDPHKQVIAAQLSFAGMAITLHGRVLTDSKLFLTIGKESGSGS